jgi:hypothetical protein
MADPAVAAKDIVIHKGSQRQLLEDTVDPTEK